MKEEGRQRGGGGGGGGGGGRDGSYLEAESSEPLVSGEAVRHGVEAAGPLCQCGVHLISHVVQKGIYVGRLIHKCLPPLEREKAKERRGRTGHFQGLVEEGGQLRAGREEEEKEEEKEEEEEKGC